MKKAYYPKVTPELIAQAKALAAMPDDTIDPSDMPEVADWSNAVRGKFYRPVKKQVSVRLDASIISSVHNQRCQNSDTNAGRRKLNLSSWPIE